MQNHCIGTGLRNEAVVPWGTGLWTPIINKTSTKKDRGSDIQDSKNFPEEYSYILNLELKALFLK